MKKIFLMTFISLVIASKSFSQIHFGDIEFLVYNSSGSHIYIQLYPAGAVFRGVFQVNLLTSYYTLNSQFYIGGNTGVRRRGSDKRIQNIVGLDGYALDSLTNRPGYFPISNNGDCIFGHDVTGTDGADGELGYGKYILKIFKYVNDNMIPICDSILIDWLDFNYGTNNPGQAPDLAIIVNGVNSNSDITCIWNSMSQDDPRHVFDSSDTPGVIQVWRQFHYFNQQTQQWVGYNVPTITNPPSLGNSYSDANYLVYPLDGRKLPFPFTLPQHNFPGVIDGNIIINHNVSTRDTLIDSITNILIPEHGYLKINPGKIFNMITPNIPSNGTNNLIIQDSSLFLLSSNSELIVDSQNKLTLENKGQITLYPGSSIIFKPGSSFCNLGGRIFGPGSIIYNYGSHILCREIVDYLYSDSAKLILQDGAILEIPDSTVLHFSGIHTGLIMNPNSKLKMGIGSKILFDNSAKLIADSAEFCSINSSNTWEGIVLENSSFDTIKNCTFSNAKTAISILNAEGASYYRRIIQKNIFNVPSGGNYKGIYGENNFRILVKDNTFNMPVSSGSYLYTGLYLKNSSIGTTAPEIEEPEPLYTMNVIHNTFNNGSASIILANYISSVSSYYIANNTFNNCSEINLLGMKINGKIKNNNFTSSSVPMGIHLINSYPDLYNNSINSRDVSLHLAGHCYPNLAPDLYGGDMYWSGGMNTFSADEIDNVQLSSSGNVYTDWGNNSFNIENTNSFHIYGLVDSTLTGYNTRNNCWTPNDFTKIYLKTYYDTSALANLYFTQGYDCESINPTGTQTNFIGSEMYDTLTISDDNSGSVLSDEEILYVQGKHYMSFDYVGAITTYKYLIDNYPDYENTSSSAEYMYECYQALDTTADTSYRNTLYGNLKIYLEETIESKEVSGEFADVAYNIILACEAILENYNEALNGYEFISLFHPDPNIRLIASWDYEEVEDLINSGSGQSVSSYELQVTSYEFPIIEKLKELKELNRLNELIKDDPIMSKMKRSYEKSSTERKQKIEKEIRNESKTSELAKENIIKSARLDNQKEDRAKRNIFESRLLNKSEKEKRRIEDMILTTRSIRNEISKNENINVPLEYKLQQNYPNPFNPVTTIKFSIPKQSFVTLKIFDILGKEVKTLVNEIKASGNYEIEFNGRNLASGVYFYRLESGEFKDIKRMILIK